LINTRINHVLSLFDGMSCGQIALNRIGIKPTKYYASEIDKYAIKITQANYPDTIQLGDVTQWREWDVDWASIDLLIGGSPCQGFSFAGNMAGTRATLDGTDIIVTSREIYLDAKDKGAVFHSQSYLFWEYVLCLDHIKLVNPDIKFMLENVKMKKELLQMISETMCVEPVFINSALVSAQNRQRYYWASWEIEQPEDKGILLADILESEGFGVIKNHGELKLKNDKSQCIDANYHKGADNHGQRTVILKQKPQGNNKGFEKEVSKSPTISANSWEHNNHIKTVEFNDRIKGVTENKRGIRFHKGDAAKSGISELGRILKTESEKTDTLTTSHMPKLALNSDVSNLSYRKLTPIECERLQTVPRNYTDHVSNTQRYKTLGNGWTVDVIAHIFSTMQSAEVFPIKTEQWDLFEGDLLEVAV
jgi:DNA-cytosine methyltransferase